MPILTPAEEERPEAGHYGSASCRVITHIAAGYSGRGRAFRLFDGGGHPAGREIIRTCQRRWRFRAGCGGYPVGTAAKQECYLGQGADVPISVPRLEVVEEGRGCRQASGPYPTE